MTTATTNTFLMMSILSDQTEYNTTTSNINYYVDLYDSDKKPNFENLFVAVKQHSYILCLEGKTDDDRLKDGTFYMLKA